MLKLAIIAAVFAFPAHSFACPTIDGIFSNESRSIGIHTRIESGKYFYNFDANGDGPWLEANRQIAISGKGESGSAVVSCSGTTVELLATIDNKKSIYISYTKVEEGALKVISKYRIAGNSIETLNDLFHKDR